MIWPTFAKRMRGAGDWFCPLKIPFGDFVDTKMNAEKNLSG